MGSLVTGLGEGLKAFGQRLDKSRDRKRQRRDRQDELTLNFISQIAKDPTLRPEEKAKVEGLLSSIIGAYGEGGKESREAIEAGRSELGKIISGQYQPDVLDTSTQAKKDQNVEAMLDQELGPKPTGEVKPALTRRSIFYSP